MACLYCRILLFRFLLQKSLHGTTFADAYRRGLDLVIHQLVPEVELITLADIESFWYSWSRSYFSIAADFCILLQVLAHCLLLLALASDPALHPVVASKAVDLIPALLPPRPELFPPPIGSN